MVSLVSMLANLIAGIFVSAINAVFSMLKWFITAFFRLLKSAYCLLPVTTIVFALLFVVNLCVLCFGFNLGEMLLPYFGPDFLPGTKGMVAQDNAVVIYLFDSLRSWWFKDVYPYHGSVVYYLLFALTIIMFVPVVSILLAISVFMSFGMLLFYAVVLDAGLFIIRAIFGQSFISQIQGRIYRLFPDLGKKHYEKDYDKWLRKRKYMDQGRDEDDRGRSFYEDELDAGYDDEEYEEYGEYEDEYEDDYEYDDYDEIDEYREDDRYEDEDEAYYEEDYEDDYRQEDNPRSSGFDFFAGCNSKESVERKYRSLAKLYHPDNMDGDTEAIQEINAQYEETKRRF